ncbi:hypothetical protein [Halarchaeum salinum]|uniref:Uncharacterized protein n=1 Tax=Halarchaeum salinum TaxID=489912 RepID=A0AAV3S8S6_9EURY
MVGAGITTVSAGCSTFDAERNVVKKETTVNPRTSELSESAFRKVAEDSHDEYGAGGIWGHRKAEPEHELAFQGAWKTVLEHFDGMQSEHILVLYRLPESPGGLESSQVWLWSGFDPAAGRTIRRLETGVRLSAAEKLGIYSPAQEYHATAVDNYEIASGRLDAQTLEATMPLAAGAVSVDPATRIGDGGEYHPYWSGAQTTAQTLAATTEIRWSEDANQEFTWPIAVETTA